MGSKEKGLDREAEPSCPNMLNPVGFSTRVGGVGHSPTFSQLI